MTTVGTGVEGGYVAVERVVAALDGRSGDSRCSTSGTAQPGSEFNLTITVDSGSGTGQLARSPGRMAIAIADGKHFYELEYTLLTRPGASVRRHDKNP